MRASTALFAAAVLTTATEASASQIGWCSMSGPYGHHYESGLIEIGDGLEGFLAFRDGAFKDQFYRYTLDSNDNQASWQGCTRIRNRRSFCG